MQTKLPFLLIFALLFTITGCEEENDPRPTEDLFFGNGTGEDGIYVRLTTVKAEALSAYEIEAEGELRTSANVSELEYGFCYSTESVPVYGRDPHVERGDYVSREGSSSFSNRITDLQSRTSYTIRTYARDQEGNVFYGNSVTVQTPNPPPLVANFTFSPQNPKIGEEVNFQNQSTGATSYEWNFGDGRTSNAQNPRYTYSRSGSFNVRLSVGNPEGQTDVITKTVRITIDPTDYGATSYQTLFQDNFSNNRNEWFEGENSSYKFDVRGGSYLCRSKNSQVWFIFRDVELNGSRNYDIEASFRLLDGGEDFGHGLRWGFDDVNNNFFFSLLPSQQYSAGSQRTSYSFWKNWTGDNIIRRSWNTLTVRRYDDNYYFFINGKFVYSRSYVAPPANQIAFAVPPRSSMEVDNIKVRYITN